MDTYVYTNRHAALIDPANVIRTYRGTPGCCCGCNGTYSSSKRAITMRTRFVNDHIDKAQVLDRRTQTFDGYAAPIDATLISVTIPGYTNVNIWVRSLSLYTM